MGGGKSEKVGASEGVDYFVQLTQRLFLYSVSESEFINLQITFNWGGYR